MAADPAVAAADVSVAVSRPFGVSIALADYWAMTKPEVNVLIGLTTAAGFYLAAPAAWPPFPWIALLQTLLGTLLVASGAAVLNNWLESPYDAKMRRTARRAIPAGRIDPTHALAFGSTLSAAGVSELVFAVGLPAALIAVVTLIVYLLFYTPLKRVTPLCTLVGSAPGAMPPLIGWASARRHLDSDAWLLFAIVFLWQFPHVMAIAWMYRDDYARAGYRVLPSDEGAARFAAWQAMAASVALLIVSLLPTVSRLAGFGYCAGALVLGAILLRFSAAFAIRLTNAAARRLLLVSVLYLPALFALLTLDRQ
jgi:heme o synthase